MLVRTLTQSATCGLSLLCALPLLATGCGHRGSTETSNPNPKKKEPPGEDKYKGMPNDNDGSKDGKPGGPLKTLWVGFENNLLLRRYDVSGKLTATCDLSHAGALNGVSGTNGEAGITAINFVNKTTLIALVDPGTGGERIVAIDVGGESPACTVTPWFESQAGFNGIRANQILPFKTTAPTEYLRVFVPRENGIDRFTWSNTGVATRTIGPGETPFVPTAVGGSCSIGTVTGAGTLGDGEQRSLLMLSSGEGATTLNVIANVMGGSAGRPQCVSSLNFTNSGQPTNKNDVPIHAVHMPDRRVYILYRNTLEGAKIVRYEFNGTTLQTPVVISQDTDDLGYQPRAMVALSANSLILATGDFITLIDTASGKLIRRWQEAPLTSFASALAIEP